MKKILLTGFFAIGMISFASAQACTPGNNFGNGIYPDSATNFVHGCKGQPYEQIINVLVPTDTTGSFQGQTVNADFDNITLDSVSGLPTGLTYATNPADGKFLPQQPGCAIIQGTTNEVGTHNLTIYMTANLSVDLGVTTIPYAQKDTLTYYKIVIDDCGTNGLLNTNKEASFNVYPNPATNVFTISNLKAGEKAIQVVDASGKVVRSLNTSDENVTVSTSDLKAGIYFVQVVQNNQKETIKLVIK